MISASAIGQQQGQSVGLRQQQNRVRTEVVGIVEYKKPEQNERSNTTSKLRQKAAVKIITHYEV